MNGTIKFRDHENIGPGTKIIMLRGLVQKLLSKVYFYKMVTNWHTSHFQTTQDSFNSFKCRYSSYPVFKCGNDLPSSNRDMVQNKILQRS